MSPVLPAIVNKDTPSLPLNALFVGLTKDMISEVVNAIFVTYLASEYLVGSDNSNKKKGSNSFGQLSLSSTKRQRWFPSTSSFILMVIVLNIFDRVSGATHLLQDFLQGLFHLPKVAFAAVAYVVALYYDCRAAVVVEVAVSTSSSSSPLSSSVGAKLTWHYFLKQVGIAFCRIVPLYPFLAVVISFGFLFVISLFEFFRLDLDLLNWPIYYGTLYGPFSLVYWRVKRRVLEDFNQSLPTSHSTTAPTAATTSPFL